MSDRYKRRLYEGRTIPVLYPGETATSYKAEWDDERQAWCQVDHYVTPTPGLRAFLLRWQIRIGGPLWPRGWCRPG